MTFYVIMLIELIATILDTLICMVYFDILFGKKKESISVFAWIMAYVLMEIPLVINTFLLDYLPNGRIATTLLSITSFLGLFFISAMYKANWLQRFYSILSFLLIAAVSEACSFFILNLFARVILRYEIPVNTSFAALVSKLILCLLTFVIGAFFRKKQKKITTGYRINILYMPIVGLLIIICIWGTGLKSPNSLSVVLNCFVSIGLISMCLFNYYLLNIQLQNQELKELNYHLEQQNSLQQMKYDQSVAAYKESRRTIHDSKKHLLYVRECALKADNQIIVDYVNQNLEEFENSRSPINTGNLAIDALIGNCVLQARDMDIDVTTNIQINVTELPLPDYDLSIILGNLTDNAMAAIKSMDYSKMPHLNMELFMTKEQFVCHFINSTAEKEKGVYDPELAFKNNTLSKHGYGLLNVSRTVQKYYGFTHFEQKDGEYESTVIIPLIHNEE